MNRSFAQKHWALNAGAAILVLALGGCASVPPPTGELSAAQQAVNRAQGADASQYASEAIGRARDELGRAQAAMSSGDQKAARTLALAATADADLAFADSRAQSVQADYRQRRQEVVQLRSRLQVDDEGLAEELPEIPPANTAAGGEALRLQQLDADPALSGVASYERLQARQSLDVLLQASRKERPDAQYIASRRVAIAELAARTQLMQRALDRLERDRSDLMVEASRQDAERARQEAERLRVQAQIQAEETARLREEAMAAQQARQQAEDLVIDVGGEQARRLKAARAREAELARQEAELMSEGDGDDVQDKDAKPE